MYEKLNGQTALDLNAFQNPVPFLISKRGATRTPNFIRVEGQFLSKYGGFTDIHATKKQFLFEILSQTPNTQNKKAGKGFRVTIPRLYF
jgi:hypothetical protein